MYVIATRVNVGVSGLGGYPDFANFFVQNVSQQLCNEIGKGVQTTSHPDTPALTLPSTKKGEGHYAVLMLPLQGGVTPIDSMVTAATAGQNFDRLFLAV